MRHKKIRVLGGACKQPAFFIVLGLLAAFNSNLSICFSVLVSIVSCYCFHNSINPVHYMSSAAPANVVFFVCLCVQSSSILYLFAPYS